MWRIRKMLTMEDHDRICLQGHHSGEHHVARRQGEGLRRSSVPEEGSRMLFCVYVKVLRDDSYTDGHATTG